MSRLTLPGLILGFLCLLCCNCAVAAAEGDELREQAKSLRQKAVSIAEQRNKEQAELLAAAEQLELKARRGGEKKDRRGNEENVHHLHQRLEKLLAQEHKLREAKAPEPELAKVREQIAGAKTELEQIHARHAKPGEHHPEFREQAQKFEAITRRIHHMRAAAEHLKQAEMHDVSRQLMEKSIDLERNVREARQRLESQMREAHERRHDPMPDVVRELRAEIERLRAEVKELSRKVEKQ